MAAALLAASSSFCYSDTITGSTNNAAVNGLNWNMNDVLPPQAGLTVNGLIYQYTLEKDPAADAQVHVQNENALGEGYIIKETDIWDGLPGSTINKILNFGNIPGEALGDGSIVVEGEATVLDPTVTYNYRFDPCYVVLTNPDCPGYEDALYDWLLENGLLNGDIDPDDPFYDEYVQMTLNRETDIEEEEEDTEEEQEEEEDDEMEVALFAGDQANKLANDVTQQAMLDALSNVPQFESYYVPQIDGGVYEESLQLQDKTLPDNRRAMRNLAQQQLHNDMVRSQYDRQ